MMDKDQELLQEAYKLVKEENVNDFNDRMVSQEQGKYAFYDRSMQPGGKMGQVHMIDPEDLEEVLGNAQKVEAPEGVDIWEDPEGNIIIKL